MWFRLLRREVEFARDAELGIVPEEPAEAAEPAEPEKPAGSAVHEDTSTPVR
jgi:hypothetical protein